MNRKDQSLCDNEPATQSHGKRNPRLGRAVGRTVAVQKKKMKEREKGRSALL